MTEGKHMKYKTESAVFIFLAICFAFGAMVGLAALGAGLIFLSTSQGIGCGIMGVGCGAFYGAAIGGKRIMRVIMKTINELNAQPDPAK